MNEIILHHYARSPFSEKVRLVLGNEALAGRLAKYKITRRLAISRSPVPSPA